MKFNIKYLQNKQYKFQLSNPKSVFRYTHIDADNIYVIKTKMGNNVNIISAVAYL